MVAKNLAPMQTPPPPAPEPPLGWRALARRWVGDVLRMRQDPLSVCAETAAQGRDLASLRFGPHRVWMVFAPDLVKEVLVEQPDRMGRATRGALLLKRTLGLSVLTAEGDEWRWRRRLVQPSFKAPALVGADRVIREVAEGVAAGMVGEVDVAAAMSELALTVVCRVLFGDDLGEDREVVHEALTSILHDYLALSTHLLPMADRLPTPRARRYRAARARLTGVLERLVARRRAMPEAPADDFLAVLLRAKTPSGCPLHANDLDAEGVTMLLAGHETTASAMAWALGCLARSPGVRRELEAELDRVLGDRPITAADLPNLPFLDAVVKETLRLYPPAWIVSRSTNVPVRIGGEEIPQGGFVFVPTHAIHRLPRYWDDPEAFDPVRWLDGRAERARKAGAYLPFGAGQRRCVGEALANLEARIGLATLVRARRFALAPGQELVPEASVTLRPAGGLRMTVSAR